jgi:drug/metabolite transporter (DMT)-like permease
LYPFFHKVASAARLSGIARGHRTFDKDFTVSYNGDLCKAGRCSAKYRNVWRNAMYQIWIAIIGAVIMACGLCGVLYLIIKQQAGITTRLIQFLTIAFVLPLLLVLGIMNTLGRETIGTLLGVIVGYVLSGFGKE